MKGYHIVSWLLVTVAAWVAPVLGEVKESPAPAVRVAQLGGTPNVHACGSLLLAGQPAEEDIRLIKEKGVKRVITLRTDGEIDWYEKAEVEGAGMRFIQIPLRSADSFTDDAFGKVRELLKSDSPTLLHCGSANRVGAVWLVHRVLDQGVPLEKAVEEAKAIGLRTEAYEERARDYIRRKTEAKPAPHAQTTKAEASVRPGINESFLAEDLDVDEWLGRFETESREVFAARNEIVKATGIRRGMHVADIGAGTGFFTRLFSDVVGPAGWVYAVDIAPRFIEHINQKAQDDQLSNVTAVLCRDDSICLPPRSIDFAFVCDTYHHFEYPKSTLGSIRRALRPGGLLIVIDFERIPGKSRQFVLDHVRAGKDVFRSEIEAAGFELIDEVKLDELEENYFLRFRRTE